MENTQSRPRAKELSAELSQLLAEAIKRTNGEFTTLGKTPAVNAVMNFTAAGIWLVTGKSDAAEAAPQLVPAWMFETAWSYLREHGRLTNQVLLKDLRVMRSSAVCAVLATLPGVQVEPGPGITLVWQGTPPC